MCVLLIGQAPGPSSDPAEPLGGASGRRLALMCGLDLPSFLARFDRVNVLDEFPGKAGRGDAFPAALARARRGVILDLCQGREVVVLGLQAAQALGLGGDFLRWRSATGFQYAIAPHPSGISHWWNSAGNVRRAQRFWRNLTRTYATQLHGESSIQSTELSQTEPQCQPAFPPGYPEFSSPTPWLTSQRDGNRPMVRPRF